MPDVSVADVEYNTKQIIKLINQNKESHVVLFPEFAISGYTIGDLVFDHALQKQVVNGIKQIMSKTKSIDSFIAVGAPLLISGRLYNCAVLMKNGTVYGIVPKTYIAEYSEFSEKRWFSSADELNDNSVYLPELSSNSIPVGNNLVFDLNGKVKIGVEICEDLWVPIPQSTLLTLNGAEIILNLSASTALAGKKSFVAEMVKNQSGKCIAGYAYTSAGCTESTTDLVFSGTSIIAENGKILKQNNKVADSGYCLTYEFDLQKIRADRMRKRTFSDCVSARGVNFPVEYVAVPCEWKKSDGLLLNVPKSPFIPQDAQQLSTICSEIFGLQVAGLEKRIKVANPKTLVIGVSGGLDSTLALLVSYAVLKKLERPVTDLVGITMPAFGTTDRTFNNSLALIEGLGITSKTISIKNACLQHMSDIGHDINVHDVTYENVQARERTQVLMDYANKTGGLVVGTGDLSELALGWCTYNADHMSMYDVNVGVPKTLIRHIIKHLTNSSLFENCREVLYDIMDTPISPELLPPDKDGKIAQKTEDLVGPYELHDFYLYYCLRYGFTPSKIYKLAIKAFNDEYSKEEILKWLKNFYRRFITQQFKRSCLPDGPKVWSIGISPRGDLKMPSDASFKLWMDELNQM